MDSQTLRDDLVDGLEHPTKGHLRTPALAAAMRTVPREPFVDDATVAYADRESRCDGTRVVAPSTAATLIEAVDPAPAHETLVVGAGTGYTVALLAELTAPERVQALDISRRAVRATRRNLDATGYGAVATVDEDGAKGLPSYEPYDRILVEAVAVAPPPALRTQLARDGRLVMPTASGQVTAFERRADGPEASGADPPSLEPVAEYCSVVLDPLLVEGEQSGAVDRNRVRRERREFDARDARRRQGWQQAWIDWDR